MNPQSPAADQDDQNQPTDQPLPAADYVPPSPEYSVNPPQPSYQQTVPSYPQETAVAAQPAIPSPKAPPVYENSAYPAVQPAVTPNPFQVPPSTPAAAAPDVAMPAQPMAPAQPQPLVNVLPANYSQPTASPGYSQTTPLYGLSAATAAQNQQSAKRKKLLIIGVVAAVLIVAGASLALIKLTGGIKLVSKSETGYSILVPADYEEKSEQGMIFYEEQEGDEDTHSAVIVFAQKNPGGQSLSSQQKDAALDALEALPKSIFESQGSKVTDFKMERTTFKKNDAARFSARVEDDGEAGEMKGILVLGDKSFYMVIVAAHDSDPGLAKKMDKIINSFEVTE